MAGLQHARVGGAAHDLGLPSPRLDGGRAESHGRRPDGREEGAVGFGEAVGGGRVLVGQLLDCRRHRPRLRAEGGLRAGLRPRLPKAVPEGRGLVRALLRDAAVQVRARSRQVVRDAGEAEGCPAGVRAAAARRRREGQEGRRRQGAAECKGKGRCQAEGRGQGEGRGSAGSRRAGCRGRRRRCEGPGRRRRGPRAEGEVEGRGPERQEDQRPRGREAARGAAAGAEGAGRLGACTGAGTGRTGTGCAGGRRRCGGAGEGGGRRDPRAQGEVEGRGAQRQEDQRARRRQAIGRAIDRA
mmetsp:Transcript_92952/g.259765  ORF Transcript_92952/g.259765 Transcript_92952/m.259765 type:complete len:298 (+) Transcript_92952:342-1235(+)